MIEEVQDAIHNLWDELAEHPFSKPVDALDLLLGTLCTLMQAQSAYCAGAWRDDTTVRSHSPRSWRASFIHHFHDSPSRSVEAGTASADMLHPVLGAGRFSVYRFSEHAQPPAANGRHHKNSFHKQARADALCATCPLNSSTELCYAFSRTETAKPFSDREQAILRYALRGLKWFNRHIMLFHGLLVASKPPTPTERKVLAWMLAGWSEKKIAAELGQCPATTHQHVKALYRKFNVRSHAELAALWLGHG